MRLFTSWRRGSSSDGAAHCSLENNSDHETEQLMPDKDSAHVKVGARPLLQWQWLLGALAGMASTLLVLALLEVSSIHRFSMLDSLPFCHSGSAADVVSGWAGSATSGKEVHLIKLRSAPAWTLPSTWKIDDTKPYNLSLHEIVATHHAPGLRSLLSCVSMSQRLAVMTSISTFPTAAQIGLALLSTPWCTIVIGDKKGPSHDAFVSKLEHGVALYQQKMTISKQTEVVGNSSIDRTMLLERIAYVDTSEQQLLPYRLHERTPYGSFSRKNLGFLLAFNCGASVIFDVDDDNIYLPNTAQAGAANADLPVDFVARHYASSAEFDQLVLSKLDASSSIQSFKPINISVFNPYPLYGAADAWPRGFPLSAVKQTLKPEHHYNGQCFTSTRFCSAVVQQWLANHDPDVDAIYRLTNMRMPFDFLSSSHESMTEPEVARAAPSIALSSSTYTPFNAQATIVMPGAFMFMMLPHSVHGRVSDIWRSYFMQTLMSFYTLNSNGMQMKNGSSRLVQSSNLRAQSNAGVAEPCVVFTSPHIYHDRNAHNDQLDFNSELPLYTHAEALITWLTARELNGERSLLTRVQEMLIPSETITAERTMLDLLMLLYVDLYEAGVVQLAELAYVQAWIFDYIKIAASSKIVATSQLGAIAVASSDTVCFSRYATT